MFDSIAKELTALQGRLAGEERRKLEVHLSSIRDVEKQLGALGTQTCATPGAPKALKASDANLTPEIMKAQIDLLVNALACDMTRVVSFQLGQEGNGSMRFPFLGHGGTLHSYSHEDRFYPKGAAMYNCLLWGAEQFAYLVSKMKAVREGDGTLLDNSWVLWVTTMHDGRHHNNGRIPLVTAGKAGGLMKVGQSLRLRNRFLTDLCTTMANVMDVKIDGYGDPSLSKGAIPELFA
jgi:hypothetical protein